VILIIGILAAIALPVFLGQQEKGQDSSAKADVRNALTQVEACYADTEDYQKCTTNDDIGSVAKTGFTFQAGAPTGKGQIQVQASGQNQVSVTARSETGTTFTITKNNGSVSRSCSGSSAGCRSNAW